MNKTQVNFRKGSIQSLDSPGDYSQKTMIQEFMHNLFDEKKSLNERENSQERFDQLMSLMCSYYGFDENFKSNEDKGKDNKVKR